MPTHQIAVQHDPLAWANRASDSGRRDREGWAFTTFEWEPAETEADFLLRTNPIRARITDRGAMWVEIILHHVGGLDIEMVGWSKNWPEPPNIPGSWTVVERVFRIPADPNFDLPARTVSWMWVTERRGGG